MNRSSLKICFNDIYNILVACENAEIFATNMLFVDT